MSGPTFRSLPAWPYPPREKRPARFRTAWGATLDTLEEEVRRIEGRDVVIGVVCAPDAITWSGALRAGGRTTVRHPGAEVSFEVPAKGGWRRLVFFTDTYPTFHANLHGIAAGLEALRTVDRHGITSSAGEQYAGFAMLPEDTLVERGRALVAAAGGDIRRALKEHHPDVGGTDADAAAINAYAARERP